MDNDDKVKDIVVKSKKIFLKDELDKYAEKPQIYSLEDEFSKTRYNKNYKLYIFISLFIGLIILSTFLITGYIQRSKDTFKLQSFEDFKLQELFNTVKKNETKLKLINEKISQLRLELQKKLNNVKSKKEKRKLEKIYNRRIRVLVRRRAKIQKEIDKYDKKLQETISKAEEMVNNFKKLHKIQMREQKNRLTLKYNPYFTSPSLINILRYKVPSVDKFSLYYFSPVITKEKIMSENEFNDFRKMISAQSKLIERLNKIPYRNSVAPALRKIFYLNNNIINTYENLWYRLVGANIKKSEIISRYNFAFNELADKEGENGYIIDAENPDDILVFINKKINIKNNDIALVFRTEDEYIGKIKLFKTDNYIKAKLIETATNKSLQPFDKILIMINQE